MLRGESYSTHIVFAERYLLNKVFPGPQMCLWTPRPASAGRGPVLGPPDAGRQGGVRYGGQVAAHQRRQPAWAVLKIQDTLKQIRAKFIYIVLIRRPLPIIFVRGLS